MHPLFSIITITYNAEATIVPTLRSIASQSCSLYEHLVIDGASTDRTLQLVEREANPLTSVYSEPDRGLYDAMNKGLARAAGDYVIFLNAGDSFHAPDTLQLIADAAMDHDYPGIIYGQTDIVDSDRRRIGSRHLTAPEVLEFKSFANGMVVCHQAFVALRKITEPFDLRYRFSADYEWCLRCLRKSKRNQYVDAVLIDYLNEGVTTRNHRRSLIERFKIMCKYYGTVPTVLRHFKFLLR